MRYGWILVFVALSGLFLLTAGAGEEPRPEFLAGHVWVPMRDHVQLSANLFRPAVTGKFPTILIRTPYGKGSDSSPLYRSFVTRGYAVLVQDVRGRGASQGTFRLLSQEPADGSDTIDWIAAQSWSDGKVGMTGSSYQGIAQWKVAVLNNVHLKAIFPIFSGDDDYRDRFYSNGGALKLGNRLLWISLNLKIAGYEPPEFRSFIWTLPLRKLDRIVTGSSSELLQTALNHPAYDDFWKGVSTRERLNDCRVPVFSVGGWYDNFVQSDLDAFVTLRKRSGANRILIGPWPHNMSTPITTVDYGRQSTVPLRSNQIEWFDQWLKGKQGPPASSPPMRIFVMGVNEWRDENEWPLARAIDTKWYFDSQGNANTFNGDGVLKAKLKPKRKRPTDAYVYDPKNPTPTLGGAVCCNPEVFPWGPYDQRPVEKRRDVLVYSSEPLREDVEVTGPISVVLFASSSAPDTDFAAKLVDVYPDGRAINLTDGLQRARYRLSLEAPRLLKTGEIAKYTIDAGVTSNVFRKGHRIRIEIASSNFPRFDRNSNTGRNIADETQYLKASQTIYHDRAHASYLLLPVIPPKPPSERLLARR